MPAEIGREDAFAVRAAALIGHVPQSRPSPGQGVTLDDERAHAQIVTVMVGDECPVFIRPKR